MAKARFKMDELKSVWNQQVFSLPARLTGSFEATLRAIGKYDKACGPSPEKVIGGNTLEAAQQHFVFRFDRSAAASGFLGLNPNGRLNPASDEMLDIFSNGKVAILDIPCGSGGGLLGFLAMIAELRSVNALKAAPLELVIVGGDYSADAQAIYKQMLDQVSPWLSDHGIYLEFETMTWDASAEPDTATLFNKWETAAKNCTDHVVLVTNFSGAAATNFKRFERSFQHIASRLFTKQGAFIWVEPGLANKSKTFFEKLGDMFSILFSSFFNQSGDMADEFQVDHPFADRKYTARIAVVRHKSEDSKE